MKLKKQFTFNTVHTQIKEKIVFDCLLRNTLLIKHKINQCNIVQTLLQSGWESGRRQPSLGFSHFWGHRTLCLSFSCCPHERPQGCPHFKKKSHWTLQSEEINEQSVIFSWPHDNFFTTITWQTTESLTVGHFKVISCPQFKIFFVKSVHWHGEQISSQFFEHGCPPAQNRWQGCRHFLVSTWFRSSKWHNWMHMWPHRGKTSPQIS